MGNELKGFKENDCAGQPRVQLSKEGHGTTGRDRGQQLQRLNISGLREQVRSTGVPGMSWKPRGREPALKWMLGKSKVMGSAEAWL